MRVGFGEPVLVISGPNTGGKTVALKTVGLLALMAQCGLHVPAAAGSRLPVFRRIYADIGDEQSIAANLSTFSAHLATIVEMTRDLAAPALVLLDEVGAGTDPDRRRRARASRSSTTSAQRGAMVVATTHHGLMKAYAQSTPGVACASFGYDPDTYEPTYRLALGAPGRSLALEMAERLGLPAAVVADARARRDDKEAQAEALLARLEKEQAELEREQARIDWPSEREVERRRGARAEPEREIAAKKRARGRGVRARAAAARRGGGAQGAGRHPRAVAARRDGARAAAAGGTRGSDEAVRRSATAQDEVLRGPGAAAPGRSRSRRPRRSRSATRVRVRTPGRHRRGHGAARAGEAEVAVSGKRLRVPRAELVAGRARPARDRGRRSRDAAASSAVRRSSATASGAAEINLVGLTVDEALPRVDKLLDDAALADRREVRVIHGFGAGQAAQGGGRAARRPSARGRRGALGECRRGRRRRDGRGAEGLAMAFPDGFVEEVRRAADIVRVISEHVALQEDGDVLEGPLPVPPGEDAVLQRALRAGGLPLLRLRRGRRRLQVRDAARAGELPGGDRDRWPAASASPVPESRYEIGPDRKEREEMLAAHGGGRPALRAHAVDGAGHEGARVPARPRLQEGDARADPRRRRPRLAGTTSSARCAASSRRGRS